VTAAAVAVHAGTDAAAALDAAEGFLVRDLVANSLLISLLLERVAVPQPGRYWWAENGDGEVAGFVFQSPLHFRALVAPALRPVLEALAARIAADAPDLHGIMGEAGSAAAFAGHWAERRAVRVVPEEAQRIYRLGRLCLPTEVPGRLRRAGEADGGVLLPWLEGFLDETGLHPLDPAELLERHLARGLWLWETEDGGPVSMAVATRPAAGMSRIGFVYTPPEHRRKGYAAACVGAVSAQVQGDGLDCILNTQLQNPTSNALYRRLGYEPIVEVLIYRFG
jgi:GNAT superfamily N-acetyltransferase